MHLKWIERWFAAVRMYTVSYIDNSLSSYSLIIFKNTILVRTDVNGAKVHTVVIKTAMENNIPTAILF